MSDAAGILADPEWLPHRLDVAAGIVRFVRLPRAAHAGLTFLGDSDLRTLPCLDLPLAPLADAPPPADLRFVFHSGFCCSTLVARAFDRAGTSMGLKEPAILNDLAALAAAGRDVTGLLGPVLGLLVRSFADGEAVVIKPSNVVTSLIGPLLAAAPQSRAVFMYAPLPDFLRSIAARGLWGRGWARRLYLTLAPILPLDTGFGARDLFEQTDLQVAALGWLLQQAAFARLLAGWPEQTCSLASDSLLAATADRLRDIARHLRIEPGSEDSAAFAGHAKELGRPFDAGERARTHQDIAAAHGEEIDLVCKWAAAVADHAGVALDLPEPLPAP